MFATNPFRNGASFFVLTALVAVASFAVVHGKYTCDPEGLRLDCGYYGIAEKDCVDRGCCWKPVTGSTAPWCFRKNSGYKYCSAATDRIDCGWSGIEEDKCVKQGCCWGPSVDGPWCYFPNANIDPATCPLDDRTDCGYPGISQDECEGKECCWSPAAGVPWCFAAKKESSSSNGLADSTTKAKEFTV